MSNQREYDAVEFINRALNEKANGNYHVADCFTMASLALSRGHAAAAAIWEEAALEELALLGVSVPV